MKKFLYSLISIWFCLVSTVIAQNPEWINYNTTNSDLPSDSIYCIVIDELGNKWIGTSEGLVKFDGTNWTVYNTSNSGLPNNVVWSIAIDGSGNKWIGTELGGLAKFDDTNWTVYNTSNSGLPDNYIHSIAIDGSGNKWIGTYDGLAKFDGTNWIVYNTSNSGLPGNWVNSLAIDGGGNKWIGTYWGLAKFDDTNWTVYNISNSGLPHNWVHSLAIDGSGNKWIGTLYRDPGGFNPALAKFDGSNWTVYDNSNSGLPDNFINSLAIDGNGNKWIGTGGGLAKFDDTNWTVYNTSNSGLPDNDVYSIVIDGSGNKWIGTTGGLAVFNEGGVVPVELTSFTVIANGKEVTLNWSTATEINNQGFEVQRSTEGKDFFTVGFVNGHGTTTEPKNYSYIDDIEGINANLLAYRLKQLDYNGSFEYSDVVYIDNLSPTEFVLHQNFPNPFNPSTKISWQLQVGSKATLRLFNILGKEVAILVNEYKPAGKYETEFNAANLPSGVYFYQLRVGEFVQTKKMLLLK